MNRELLQQALDQLVRLADDLRRIPSDIAQTIAALEAELAKPEQNKPLRLSPMYEYGHIHDASQPEQAEYDKLTVKFGERAKEYLEAAKKSWEPEQEPVAWISDSPTKGNGKQLHFAKADAWKWSSNITPLYAAPPRKEWVGLTDEEVDFIADSEWEEAFVRLVEAKLKERNT